MVRVRMKEKYRDGYASGGDYSMGLIYHDENTYLS